MIDDFLRTCSIGIDVVMGICNEIMNTLFVIATCMHMFMLTIRCMHASMITLGGILAESILLVLNSF